MGVRVGTCRPGTSQRHHAGDPARQAPVCGKGAREVGELEVGVGVDESWEDDRITEIDDRR
jgi:hypothetical protein